MLERGKSGIRVKSGPWVDQKLIVPSPLRPHTTMAIEKLNRAAREAQAREMSMGSPKQRLFRVYLVWGRLRSSSTMAALGMPALRMGALGVQTIPAGIRQRQRYPHLRVVVLDDDVNTFQHVVNCLVRYLPGMGPDRAWELAHQIDSEGSAVVWSGPQEQAELYHQQLSQEGLTMAPLERD